MASAATRYVALLRGINVGGQNPVKMADLRAAFDGMGFADVASYIASGNVLFSAPKQSLRPLAARIENVLTIRFGIDVRVVLLTAAQLRAVVASAPEAFGAEDHLSDVVFLRAPLTVREAMAVVEVRDGVDRAWPGRGVIYFTRLAARKSSSRLSKIVGTPQYQDMTIRSWSTTTKLLVVADGVRSGG